MSALYKVLPAHNTTRPAVCRVPVLPKRGKDGRSELSPDVQGFSRIIGSHGKTELFGLSGCEMRAIPSFPPQSLELVRVFATHCLLLTAGGRAASWGECQGPCSELVMDVWHSFIILFALEDILLQ